VAGVDTSVADLGGNIRVVVASNTPSGPLAAAVLVWLPLSDPSQAATQNEMYRNAFFVLVKTVNSAATEQQQATLATQLKLTPTTPPFPTGASASATLNPEQYRLEALQPDGQSGPDTLIAVTQIS